MSIFERFKEFGGVGAYDRGNGEGRGTIGVLLMLILILEAQRRTGTMTDERILAYIRANRGKFPDETIKAALIDAGCSEAEVTAAFTALTPSGQESSPALPESAPAAAGKSGKRTIILLASAGLISAAVLVGLFLKKPMATVPNELQAITRLAEAGDLNAQIRLARHFGQGIGVKKNMEEASRWASRAGERAHCESGKALAKSYTTGDDPSHSPQEYLEWLTKTAERGGATAQLELGCLNEHGELLPQDHAKALDWYKRAAQTGDPSSQTNLCLVYDAGRITPTDKKEAAKWCQNAAMQGDLASHAFLYSYYVNRNSRDLIEAYKWLLLMAKQDFKTAAQDREGFLRRGILSREQIAEAERRAQEVLAQPGYRPKTD